MSLELAQEQAVAQYKDKAAKAREASEKAKKAREAADATPASDKLAAEAAKEEDKAKTAEKNEHLAEIKTRDTHVAGEENGCVTRCVWTSPRQYPFERKCLFEGHDHKKNAVTYHTANDRHWYNLPFHKEGNRARKRLEAALGFRYQPKVKETKKSLAAGKKIEMGIRMAGRDDKNNPLITAGAWDLGKGDNFKKGGKQARPWSHQAHHLIPTDALYQAFEDDTPLLQQLKYNINKGLNVMVLPTRPMMGWVYLLPAHVNSHPGYSRVVETRVKSVRGKVGKQQAKTDGHPELSDKQSKPWKSQLENISTSLRKLLRKTGLAKGLSGQFQFATVDDAV